MRRTFWLVGSILVVVHWLWSIRRGVVLSFITVLAVSCRLRRVGVEVCRLLDELPLEALVIVDTPKNPYVDDLVRLVSIDLCRLLTTTSLLLHLWRTLA